jgi:uncharacterized transporter YbjL
MAMIHIPTVGSVTFGLHVGVIAVAMVLGLLRRSWQINPVKRYLPNLFARSIG